MSAHVRRGTYRRRCARCFWEGTYDTAARADYAKRRHSCHKRETAMLRAAIAEDREAAIDRTPKPCLHKAADHQHGQRATYVLDKCRCIPCSQANAAATNQRERLKAYGRYNKYVTAEHVRAHLAELGQYGIGLKRVAALSGVSTGTLSKIVFGVYQDTGTGGGCNGPGIRVREPSRRVLRSTAEKIYAVEAIPANLGSGQADHERTPTARLHLRALVALGWSQSKLATRLGVLPTNLGPVIGEGRTLTRNTVDKIEDLYADLSMTLPPEAGQRDKIAASRARNYAKARGWQPPLDLEDVGDLEDDGGLDEVAIQRRMNGDKTVRLNHAERIELAQRWAASGRSMAEMQRHTGVAKPERYYRLSDQGATA